MSEQTNADQRIRWMCRRGMLELDYLFSSFFDRCYGQLSFEERTLFFDFLAFTDVELYGWLIQKEKSPREFDRLIEKILAGSHDKPRD